MASKSPVPPELGKEAPPTFLQQHSMYEREQASLPEGVASVYQLVSATLRYMYRHGDDVIEVYAHATTQGMRAASATGLI